MPRNEIQAREQAEEGKAFRKLLEADAVQAQLQKALPKHLARERFTRQAVSLAYATPGLLKCSQASLVLGVLKAAELGLELAGPLGHAYLVPRWNKDKGTHEAGFQVGYRGFIALAHRSGKVQTIQLREVRAGDHFQVRLGTHPEIEHVPNFQEPGDTIAYYCAMQTSSGAWDFEVLSKREAERHRDRYRSAKGAFSPWDSHFDAMALKTTCRRLGKRLPVSVELQRASVHDEYEEEGVRVPCALARDIGMDEPLELGAGELVEDTGKADAQAERMELAQAGGAS